MKQTKMLVNWLVACAVAVAMVASAQAAERTGKVVRVKGSARYSTGNNVWQPLTVGTQLKAGAIVQAAKDSFVDIVLGESDVVLRPPTARGVGAGNNRPAAPQDIVRVWEESVLAIDKLTVVETGADKVTETQLDLRSGKVLGSVKKMSAASRFEVKVPNGVAGIRGTLFEISVPCVVAVAIGEEVFSWTKADGSIGTQVVTAGWQFDCLTGALTKTHDVILNQLTDFQVEGGAYFTTSTTFETFGIDPIIYTTRGTTFGIDETIFHPSPN